LCIAYATVYVLTRDLVLAGHIAVPPGPGPRPACSDAELPAIAAHTLLLACLAGA
jgi:hypothetical protein